MKINTKKKTIAQNKLISNLRNHYGNMNNSMVIVLFLLILGVGLFLLSSGMEANKQKQQNKPLLDNSNNNKSNFNTAVAKFKSVDEFKEYLSQGQLMGSNEYYGNMGMVFREMVSAPNMMEGDFGLKALDSVATNSSDSGSASIDRYSETNVQVAGIDEPDILKTDGQNIYYAKQQNYYLSERMMAPMDSIYPYPYQQKAETAIIKTLPLADMKLLSKIDKTGQLLLKDNMLVVFSGSEINGYNISNRENPEKKWTINLDSDSQTIFDQARLYNDDIYLITHTYINANEPCPIRPLSYNGEKLSIACSDIYHPISPIPANSTYVAMKLNIESGKISDTTSFVARYGQSVVYMSNESLYISYPQSIDMFSFYVDFLNKDAADLLTSSVKEKVNKILAYDLSNYTKMMELGVILENWKNSLGKDEQLRVETELENRFQNYYKDNKRNLANTGIVKINIADLKIKASGGVPGSPLNQWSLDEYKGNLRIATTLGDMWDFSFGSTNESANDLYVLGEDLKIIGKLLDMGLTERIYSARFIEDKAYIVTFRQTDPFYVIDLSDPKTPVKKGELKIPGYSAYLHPINKDRIIGIGEEAGKVKISLFDVSDASDPKELAKYTLDEYYTEVNNNSRAFMMDEKYKVFFIPGSKGGYILSYDSDKLTLVKAAQMDQVKRAIFVNDLLYVVGESQIKVYDEKTWVEQKIFDLLATE
jgi:inhibitor of cysteine peptidase